MIGSSRDHAGPPPPGVSDFAPVEPGPQSMAVLPLGYRGPAEDAYLAAGLTEELVERLSMSWGLRVPTTGATEPFTDRRDAGTVREALDVDTMLDGTLQRVGARVQISARLFDTHDGQPLWSDRVEGTLSEVLQLQDRLATGVAKVLKLPLAPYPCEHMASPEAVALYLQARAAMRGSPRSRHGPQQAPALLRQCLELAPDLPPAWVAHATACSRRWSVYGEGDGERERARACQMAVARALEVGAHLPEAHVSSARVAMQRGRLVEAAQSLQHAIELAPSHAAAHGVLGILQCEAGRALEGVRHVDLAVRLDPSRPTPLLATARHLALSGYDERYRAIVRTLSTGDPGSRFALKVIGLRVALWRHDLEGVRHWRDALARADRPTHHFGVAVGGYVLGERNEEDTRRALQAGVPRSASHRYRAFMLQLLVEGLLARGRIKSALTVLEQLAADMLVDVDWLERCPLLESLGLQPRVLKVRARVRGRAAAIWAPA